MPLLSGTALQNGHYVIDALLEEASNGNFYWGTHVPTGLAVYLQELVTGDTGLSPELATCLQGLAFAPQPPLPNPLQLLQEGDRHYLAMGTGLGRPWCYGYRHYSPVAPKAALALTQRTGEAIQTLLRQGLPTVDLSPNRLWVTAGSAPVILTGLTVPPETSDLPFAHPLKGLAALLYSLLTGSLPTVADLPHIGEALSQQCPNLSPLILQGIQQGLGELAPAVTTATASSLADCIHQWLQTLPDGPPPQMPAPIQGALPTSAPAPTQAEAGAEAVTAQATMAPASTEPAILTPDPTVATGSPGMETGLERVPASMAPEVLTPEPLAPVGVEPGPGGVLVSQGDSAGDRAGALVPVVVPHRRPRRRLLPALGLTAVVAAMGGAAMGAAWRFNLTELSDQVRLNPEQTFPTQGDWRGDRMTTEFENPFFSEGEGVRSPFPESLPDSSSFDLDLERSIAPREPWGDVEPDRWEPLPVEPEPEQRPAPVAPPPVTPPTPESPAPITPVVPENPPPPRPPAAPAPERDTTPEMPAGEQS